MLPALFALVMFTSAMYIPSHPKGVIVQKAESFNVTFVTENSVDHIGLIKNGRAYL